MSDASVVRGPSWTRASGVVAWLLGIALGGLWSHPDAQAYQIKRVLRGSVAMSTTAEVQPVDLTPQLGSPVDPLDVTKSFVIITNSINLGTADRRRVDVRALIDDPQTVLLIRNTSTTVTNVEYMVVEFTSGVTVLSGVTTMPDQGTSGATKNIILPQSVTLSKAFPLLTWKSASGATTTDYQNMFSAELVTPSTCSATAPACLQLVRIQTASNYNNDLSYEVVIFDPADADVNVQYGTTTLSAATSATATLSPAVNTAKSILFFTSSPVVATGGIEEQYMVDGTLTNSTTLTFSKAVATNSTTIKWYLVEFKNEAFAQSGRIVGNTTATGTAPSFTSTDMNRTFGRVSASGTGAGGANDTSGLDETLVRAQLTNATTFTWTREPSGTIPAVNVSWFAIELPLLNVTSPNGGELWKVGETRNITWQHAKQLDSGGTCGGGAGPGHKLKLELDTASGTGGYPLSITGDVCANLNTYAWVILAAIGATDVDKATLRVKITDLDYLATTRNFDASNADFEIKGTLTISAPNTNLTWFVGDTTRNITWTKTGNLDDNGAGATQGKAQLELWTAGGAALDSAITPGTGTGDPLASALTYLWNPIPDKVGNWRVKIKHLADTAGIFDFSDIDFTVKGTIAVTYPNATGITLETLKPYNITWTKTGTFPSPGAVACPSSGGVTNQVDILYSTNSGGSFPTTIATCQPAGTTSGSYSWTVPSTAVSSFGRVRVQQSGDSSVLGTSANDFTVISSITVNSPGGGVGEVLLVNNTQNITWTINGTGITNVKLEYSTNGFSDELQTTLIADPIPATPASYSWIVPNSLGSNVKVRVSNSAMTTIKGVSPNPFTIKGRVHVLAPNGGETWTVGSSRVIQWEVFGTLTGTVTIAYSTDGVTFPNTITSTPAVTALSYTWNPIPDVTGGINNTVKVRITPSDVNGVSDDSDANLSIKGSLTLTAPAGGGGQMFLVNSGTNITWTKTGSIGAVKLLYSTDGGVTFPDPAKLIISGLDPVTGTPYAWTVPDDITPQARVKVQLVADSAVNSVSANNFEIRGSLTVVAPNGAETWFVGDTTRQITWTRVGTTGNMTGNAKLEYSTDGGATYPNLINNTTLASALAYTWNPIPDAIGINRRVKISLVGDPNTNDASDANFTVKGKLALTSPNTAVTWIVGSAQNITWTTTGTISNVTLYYSTNSGGTYPNTIASNITNVGAYNWTVPDAISSTVRVKLENVADTSVFSTSAVDFAIRGSLTITAPNGGETWIVNGSQNITWTKTGTLSGNVKLLYSTDGGATFPDPANKITDTTAVTALSYAWTIPDAIGATLKVRIIYLNDTTVTDDSDANFTIKGSLTITAPNGGEVWDLTSTQNIAWTKTGTLGNVKLEYSTDGGVTYPNLINGSVSSTSPYPWTISAGTALSTTARIKITLLSDTTVADTSDNNFRLRGKVTITAPTGSETWVVGAAQNITWSVVGGITNVKIEYSTDGGVTYPAGNLITASTPAASGSYSWPVADGISAQCRVRISDASDATIVSSSAANFTIKGSLTITAPNGGENWVVGTSQNITWTKTGTIPNVKLDYATDGVTFTNAITASTSGSSLSYAWTIPDAIGTSLKVKITNVSDSTVSYTSAANFTIKGSITVTAPNGAEQWPIGSSQTITWTKTGTLTGNLKLEYSTDGGSTYLVGNLISNTVAATLTSYAWIVPDNPSIQARVRITQLNDTSVLSQSAANFSIKGSLTVTSPNTAVTWVVNEIRNITWTKGGNLVNSKLDYSTDGGATYPNAIVASVPTANLSYAWTVPDAIGTQVRVRITDLSDSTVNDASDVNFTIKGSVTLTAPNGGETWIVNDVRNVTWTKTGTIPNVKLEYSTDGGATYPTVIAASVPGGNLTYAWTVPDAIGSQLRVRITNLSDATVTSSSVANFTIKGSVTLTSPVGGETWLVNDVRNVTWTKQGSIANVKLEYSKNGFLDELQTFTIVASTAATPLTYAWTVADAIGTAVKVRVSDASDSTVKSVSAANFTIKGKLVLTAPNGGEAWTVLSNQNVTWTRTGSIANVKLEYSTDGGSTFPNLIVASTTASAGTYAWTIPDAIGSLVKVRVSDASDATVNAVSAANFKIVGSVAVTAPVGGEKWTVNSSQNITWTRVGTVVNVKLEYSTDGGTTYPNTIIASTAASAGSYAWTVPNTPSATVKVRVSDASDATVNAVSAANFKIKAGITVTAPNGGEVWTVNSPQSIAWNTVGTAANVKLEYSTDGGNTYPNLIIASTTNTGSYSWTVPDAISTAVRVKVTNAVDVDSFGASTANFKIRGSVTVTAPNGGEGWAIATVQNVTWTRVGSIANVKLEYSTNGFVDELQTVIIIASTAASAGTYAWTIPDAPSATVKVRASDSNDATVSDLSNANFSIKGSLTVVAPNGSEVWVVGATNNITWTKFGAITNVELRYSTDGGATYPAGNIIIASTAASALSYSWTIPDAIGTQLRVKITDVGDGSVTDPSDANFKIRGSITLTMPTGGQTWIVGASQNITWTKTGSFANVKLEYSTNSGATYPNLITASAPNTGTFAWTIPDAIGTTLRVRASDAADATVISASAADFTVKGSLALTSPLGGELWRVGESRNITWTKTGTIAFVKLEYSTNGGTTYPNVIIASTDATTGTYAWTVPDAIGTQVRVRVTNTADATVMAASPANFEIKGALTITAPVGGEVWTVSSSRNITWTKQGTFANVKLEYSTDGGTTYPTVIAASVDAVLGTPYAWTVPDAIGTQLRVRVTNTADTAVVASSPANFKVTGSLSLTMPSGGQSWTVSSSQNITWTKTGSIANVKLEYSTDGGTTYPNVIVASTAAGTGAYAWTIPDAIGTNRRVRVSDASDSTVLSTSSSNFTIMGGFTITAPNGGQVWSVGSAQTITWTTAGTVANVKLEYSTDGGVTYPAGNLIIASTANTGTYGWTVPDAITTTAKVRVSDVGNANALGVSPANFKIRGGLTVTAPVGGEAWTVGASQNITWTRTGSIANVKLEYSTNSFSDELQTVVISASAPAAGGSYAWTIPDAISSTVKVRVSDASDATVVAVSPAAFSIRGSLTLTAPVGSEVWIVGATQNITWTKTGSIANVKLEYSTDAGATYPVGNLIIASTAASALTYSWTIPDAIGTQLRVRVSDASNAAVNNQSPANFKIRGSVSLTAPVGGETWVVGASQNITWTKTGSFPNVKLEYSTDGGLTYPVGNLITASTPNTSPFAWTVPDAIGTSLRVRISDAADATVVSNSAANFTIRGSLAVVSPNGAELWRVGESRNITWTKTGTIANVKLEYSADGGVTYPNVIIASTAAATGSYAWTVADAIGTNRRVRITNTADATVTAASAANFEIKGQVTVTAPNGGEVWTVGSSRNITWTKQGTFATVKLEYSTNAFANELQTTVIAASVDAVLGTPYAWTVPDVIGTTLRVRVTNNTDTAVLDVSDANFKVAGSLALTAPVGGESWTVGSSQVISWTKTGSITNVKLDYSTDGGTTYANVIVASTSAGAGVYSWTIPDAIGANRRVRVSDASDSTVFSSSPANFKILGGFTLSSPNGGEVWTVGASQNITWTTTGTVANVKLEYSTDGGSTYPNVIAATTANTGTYAWTVPDAISTTVRVRISDVLDVTALKTSAANFKIRGSLLLTAPNGGEGWPISTVRNITWTRTGSIANVKLEYSTDGGLTYPAGNLIIASTAASTGTYAWTIPDAPSATAKVRITDVSDSTVTDDSNANFSIKGLLTVTAPNGGQTWIVGSSYNITWTKFGAIANVKLQYSTDGGTTWPDPGKVIIASTAASLLSYTWTIPDDISTTVKVRITDTGDASVFDDSDATFSIKGSLTVTAPIGGETWIVASTQNITWTKTGTIPNVKLEYSKNGFVDELQTFLIIASVPSTPSTYAWTIPDAISSTVKVRVSNVTDATVLGLSGGNFAIKGSVTLNAPVGGEVWTVGSSQPITWSKVGSIANVALDYSTDGGVSYPNSIVASTAASAGSYSWTIPDAITTTARVKVTNTSDASVSAVSAANFKIAGSLTVTAPNGAEAWLIGSTQNITWTKTGSIANVKLEYSTDGGVTYPTLIVASVSASLGTPYAWVIPDSPTTAARVKVTNTADATVFKASTANFNIRGSVTLTAPTGSEVWVVGQSRNIAWTRTGSFTNVKLDYSTDGGATYPNLITVSTLASALSYAWTVPDAISTTVRVKITQTDDSAVTSASAANFKIKGSVSLTAPNGAEVWIVGAAQNITWTKAGSFANVKLEYSTNGFFDELQTVLISASAPAAPLSYAWTVPDAIGTSVKVRISDAADATVTATSAANFTIKGSLALNAPVGGETWVVGASQNITWAKTGTLASVKLEYSTDSGVTYPNVISASTAASALSYAWTIPDSISATVRVKITNLADTTVNAASAANFKIAGSLTLTSPIGGEVWLVGQNRNITWTKTGSLANAKLEYSTNGGVSYPNLITASTSASALSFAWTVPDNMSSTVKVKITDASDATVTSASGTNFKIVGSFTIMAPNGGEKWPAGSTQSITWTKTGSILNAKIEYSTDGGLTYPNLIVATTPASNLSYAWTLGATTSTQFRVRITDVSDSTVFDASDANFKVMGGFTMTAPSGGEVWVVGTTQSIVWTTSGSVANAKLFYSIDGGTTYPNVITASTANTGSYAWTIPDAIGTTLRIKVQDVLDVDAFGVSAANFKIKGSLTLSAPVGGEIWSVASAQNITWTKTGSIANLKIEYSTDGGVTYPAGNLIAASVAAGLGTYAWTVPDAISTTVKVRITDVTDATVTGASPANFTIRGAFTMTAPTGGQKWTVGTTQAITWTTFGTIPNVKLEYSTDGGVTYPNVIVVSVANTGTYNWSIPNAITATARVRVSNAADPGTLATSAANFKIMAGFSLTAPAGGEVWVVGASQSIMWTTTGTVSNVKLEYSTDSGATYPAGNLISASTPNSGTFAWTVPNAISATVRVRVSDATDTVDAFTASAANFKIRAGFTLTSPSGGQAWAVSTVQNITWTTSGTVPNVKLEYSTDGGATYPNVIAASITNTGTYTWTIPDAITAAARVRVSDVNDVTSNAASGTNFKIQGSLTVTAPNGAEQWTVGSIRTVTWNRAGSISFVKLDFSTNSGALYAPITASTSNTGSYAWTIPDNISTTCLVKVSDTNDATVNDVSDAVFKIQAGFSVTAPSGGEVWGVGSARTIAWTTQGTVSFVKIDYSTDGGTTYPNLITSSTSNLGTYAWTVPDNVTGTARVRVSQTTDAQAFGTSAGNFRIRVAFTVASPNGAEQWRVGQVRNITWSVVGTIPNVKLQYSRDLFNVDLQTISASSPSIGTYAWTMPDAISNTVRVRISDPNDIGAFDDSNADFRITGDFTVTAPNGAEQWTVGSSRNITWTKTGSVGNAKIEYSTNSGGTWTTIAGLATNNGLFAWTVPDAITAQGRVRLSDPNDATANDLSDSDFKIKAAFTLLTPNGSEIWTVGTTQNVTWTNTGTVPNVKLEYSTNSGTTYPSVIVASAANTGTYAWTIPDAVSTGVRVRVSSATDTVDAFDTSDADLKIRGAFTVTVPNGGEGFKIAQTQNITWTTTGTVPTVKLSYSTNGGTTYPSVIIASVTNTNTYAWLVPDVPTTTARVRVESTADNTVYDDSNANFSLQGNFTVTAPNGGEVWSVGDVRNITWTWGGTIPNVKLSYSTDSGATYPAVISASALNGVGSSGTFSYAWTVPDSISTSVRVKVQDVNDATVFDASDANFKIQGKLTVVAPNGAERWVVNQTKTILWTTTGTIPTVKLEYSTDAGLTYPAGNLIAASVTNTGSYNWVIPNNISASARVRVSNTADPTVFGASAANFSIDYYQITFQVKDLLTNNNLDQVTVNASTNPAAYTWAASGLASPIVKSLQGGSWSATFTRVSYGDQTANFVADSDQTIQVFMETQVVHLWEAATELAYDTVADKVSITSTLKRDGSIVSGATFCEVKFYDGSTLVNTFTNSAAPNAQGFYSFTWNPPTGLIGGKVYNVTTEARISTGGKFVTPRTFSITDIKKLQDVQNTIAAQLDKPLSAVEGSILGQMQTRLDTQKTSIDGKLDTQTTNLNTKLDSQTTTLNTKLDTQTTNLNTKLDSQTTTLNTKLDSQTTTIQTKMDTQTASINASLTSFETKSNEQINKLNTGALNIQAAGDKLDTQAIKAKATNLQFAGKLILPKEVLLNSINIVLSYIGPRTGLVPLITLATRDENGKAIIIAQDVPMTPNDKRPELYEYQIKKLTSPPYQPGKAVEVKVVASRVFEDTKLDKPVENLEFGSFLVESTTLSTLEGLIAGQSGVKSVAQDTFNAVKALQTELGTGGHVSQALQNLNRKVDGIPKSLGKDSNATQMKNTINEIAKQIKTLAGDNMGYDMSQIVGKALDESAGVRDIRKKADEVQGTTEIMQILLERKLGGVDAPVVQAIFE